MGRLEPYVNSFDYGILSGVHLLKHLQITPKGADRQALPVHMQWTQVI